MPNPLILYSTSSFLAYQIANQYYPDIHYTWCSPIFDGRAARRFGPSVPPTSSPCEIYWNIQREVDRGDRHSSKITDIKSGMIRGAQVKRKDGIIDAITEADIIEAVTIAKLEISVRSCSSFPTRKYLSSWKRYRSRRALTRSRWNI